MQNLQTPLPVGTIIRRRYLVQDQLSKSSYGAVYLVRDQRVKRSLFVLKEVILPEKKEQQRFIFQAVRLRQLSHPALPHVYDAFVDDMHGQSYILMNYIEGPSLEILRLEQPKKCFSWPQIMTIMAPIMDAVTYLHRQHPPIIHGDIKPTNIILPNGDGEAILVDLGITKERDTNTLITDVHSSTSSYGAPEQYSRGTSRHTDIYALGATLYTLLTGIVPGDASYRATQLNEKKPDPLVPVNKITPGAPITVARIIHRAMSISSNDRFLTVEQFWRVLNAYSKTQQSPLLQVTAQDYKVLNDYPVPQQAPTPIIPSVPPQPPNTPKKVVARPAAHSVPKRSHTFSFPFSRKFSTLWPIARKQTTAKPVIASLAKQSHVPSPPRFGKLSVALSAILLALLIILSLGAVFSFYVVSNHRPVSAPPITVQHKDTSSSSPRPTVPPTPTFSVNIVGSYKGTIYNIPLDLKTNMSLTSIQQSQRNIRGYFTGFQANGLQVNEPFSGMIDVHRNIHFTVAEYAGHITLSFEGTVQADGNLAGSYCSLGQNGQCAGEYGLWSAAPES